MSVFKKAVVTTENEICSKIGKEILQRGGNAVDAGISSAFCVGLINNFSSGIGGDGFAIVYDKKINIRKAFDFRGPAPAEAGTYDYCRNIKDTYIGAKSITVPLELKGLYKMHCKYGKMEWKKLLQPVIDLAFNGFPVSEILYNRLTLYKEKVSADEGLRKTYMNGKKIKEVGEIIYRKNLALTLKRISENPNDFYEGKLANQIVEFVQKNGGFLRKEDLINAEVKETDTLNGKYKNFNLHTVGLPSNGINIIQAFNILENLDLRKIHSIDNLLQFHILIEIMKFASANIGELGDDKFLFNKDLIKNLLSKENALKKALKIDLNQKLNVSEYEFAGDFKPDSGTTHINVLDENGMAFLLTSSVNTVFGSCLLDDETGIIFNNNIEDFYFKKDNNNSGNRLAGGKKPFSSMAPFIMENEDEIILIGGAGGIRITTSIFSTLFYILNGYTIKNAVDFPRIHHQFIPNIVYYEDRLSPAIIAYLEKKGHKLQESIVNKIYTSIQIVQIKNNKIIAYADRRKGGMENGY